MITSIGGSEKKLVNASAACIILSEEQRVVIAEKKGEMNISEFIREAIMACDLDTEDRIKAENWELREENKLLKTELAETKRKEEHVTKEKEEVMAYIAQGYNLYKENNTRSEDPAARQGWITARCKDSGVSPAEFLAYAERLKL